MIILGLNVYHGDSSACILVDGKLIAAVEEERITRIKRWADRIADGLTRPGWCVTMSYKHGGVIYVEKYYYHKAA